MELDFVTKKANQLISYHIDQGVGRHAEVVATMDKDLSIFDEDTEKIKYLQIVLAKVNSDYATHLEKCEDPETCHLNDAYEHIKYFISKQMKHLGIRFNDDTFTAEEKQAAESKLDKILSDLFEIKTGQIFMYEEFARELEELRNLYYLGKKNWLQLLVGKSVEMAAAGIVSETVSKQLIEQFHDKVLPMLNA